VQPLIRCGDVPLAGGLATRLSEFVTNRHESCGLAQANDTI